LGMMGNEAPTRIANMCIGKVCVEQI
jgi:hypothetical protein